MSQLTFLSHVGTVHSRSTDDKLHAQGHVKQSLWQGLNDFESSSLPLSHCAPRYIRFKHSDLNAVQGHWVPVRALSAWVKVQNFKSPELLKFQT